MFIKSLKYLSKILEHKNKESIIIKAVDANMDNLEYHPTIL